MNIDIEKKDDNFEDMICNEAKQTATIYRAGQSDAEKKGYNQALSDVYNYIENLMLVDNNPELKQIRNICTTWKKN